MSSHQTTLERAFQIARGGQCASLKDLEKQLKSEQFDGVDAQLMGKSVRDQLRTIIEQARVSQASPER